jgi:hypothetical protein
MHKLQSFILHDLLPFVIGILLVVIIFISLIQGGFHLILAVNTGLFMRWEPLPALPTEPVEILPSRYGIWVRDTYDTVYTISVFTSNPQERDKWVVESEPILDDWLTTAPPCTAAEIPSSFYSSSPMSILDCREFSAGPEAVPSYLVFDQNHQFWLWRNMHSAWDGVFRFGLLAIVAFIGSPMLTIVIMKWGFQLLSPQTEDDDIQTI